MADPHDLWHDRDKNFGRGGHDLADWYFAADGVPDGPHSEEDIRSLLLIGRIGRDTLIWCEGMPQWAPLRSQTLFQDVRPLPPPLPQPSGLEPARPAPDLGEVDDLERPTEPPAAQGPEVEAVDERPAFAAQGAEAPLRFGEPISVSAPVELPRRNIPWSRCFARVLDLTIALALVVLATSLAVTLWSPDFYSNPNSPNAGVLAFLYLPMAMVLNGIVMALFGTTPGRAVMALNFTYPAGPLGVLGHIRRELYVWVQGLACGVAIVSMFTGIWQYRRVAQGLPASYDVGSVIVQQAEISRWRRAIGMLFCVSVLLGAFVFALWPRTAMLEEASAATLPVEWTNPLTGKSAPLPPGWSVTVMEAGNGEPFYLFHSADRTKQAIWGAEGEVAGLSDIASYAQALKISLADKVTLGKFSPAEVPGMLRAHGSFNGEDWRATALVMKVGPRFWRIVSLAAGAKEGDVTDPDLAKALWSTTQ